MRQYIVIQNLAMSYFKFHDLSKKTERLQKEISDSQPLWGENGEDEEKQLRQVKKKWLRQQNQEFQKLKHQESQNRSIKTLVSTLISIALIAIALPFLPKLWQISVETVAEFLPKDSQTSGKPKKGGFLEKLKAMQDEYKHKEKIKQLVKVCEKDPQKTSEECQTIAEMSINNDTKPNNVNDYNDNNGKVTIEDQLLESLDNIDQYNKDVKKAIEMSE